LQKYRQNYTQSIEKILSEVLANSEIPILYTSVSADDDKINRHGIGIANESAPITRELIDWNTEGDYANSNTE